MNVDERVRRMEERARRIAVRGEQRHHVVDDRLDQVEANIADLERQVAVLVDKFKLKGFW